MVSYLAGLAECALRESEARVVAGSEKPLKGFYVLGLDSEVELPAVPGMLALIC